MAKYINNDTFEIREGRTISDKTGWTLYEAVYSETETYQLPRPKCDRKYWKWKDQDHTEVIEKTTKEKTDVDTIEQTKIDESTAETLIENKKEELVRQQAIDALITEEKLNIDGSLKK